MPIKIIEGIDRSNADLLCKWSNEQGVAFQEQWMGTEVTYPLTCEKIAELKDLFSIFNEEDFIGVIQKVRTEGTNVHIGRFVIDPQKTGMGFGTKALESFIDFIFEDERIDSISLTVYDSNLHAKKLYQKLGFEVVRTITSPKLKYIMVRRR